ncbi:MAG: hypothetical protein ACYS1A_19090 [Planctomycetota bacterium]|jgi:hypothetical protein
MKRLTLDETWKKCLSMWRWIAKQKRKGCATPVWWLKTQWMEEHGYEDEEIEENCFFCDYANHRQEDCEEDCDSCPARMVEKDFNCQDEVHHWARNPIVFYNKLVLLNRKRLAKKK